MPLAKPVSKPANTDEDGSGARSNHQRLQAVELLGHLVKETSSNEVSRDMLAKHIEAISNAIVKSVDTAASWKNKKVSKTIQVVNLYVKAGRILVK